MGTERIELPQWESLELIRQAPVGRLCIIDHGYPLAFPLNYRLLSDPARLVFRIAPTSALAAYEGPASVEVDHIDLAAPAAWSVIVRGSLRRAADRTEHADTQPLLTSGRFHWVVLDVAAVSGRRFVAERHDDAFAVEWQPVS